MNNNQSTNNCINSSKNYNNIPNEVRINLLIEQIEKSTETSIKKIINYFFIIIISKTHDKKCLKILYNL